VNRKPETCIDRVNVLGVVVSVLNLETATQRIVRAIESQSKG